MSLLDELYFYKALGYKYIRPQTRSNLISPSFDELNLQIKYCNLCDLCKTRSNSVLGSGNKDAKIMILGEFPDLDEDKIQKANLPINLLNLISNLQIPLNQIYYTYILKCTPLKSKHSRKICYNQCLDFFKSELNLIKPNLIVVLGQSVFEVLFGDTGYSYDSIRGGIFSYENTNLLATHSPKIAQKSPNLTNEFAIDLIKIKDFL